VKITFDLNVDEAQYVEKLKRAIGEEHSLFRKLPTHPIYNEGACQIFHLIHDAQGWILRRLDSQGIGACGYHPLALEAFGLSPHHWEPFYGTITVRA